MRATTRMARSMESVPLSGQTTALILENSTIIIFMAKVFTPGLTAENMKANGAPTKCMEKAPSTGQMVENM